MNRRTEFAWVAEVFSAVLEWMLDHAAELFALKAMQGEILTSGDPYTIPQKGFNHAWDAHGGGAYLHEHLVDVSTATARLTQTAAANRTT